MNEPDVRKWLGAMITAGVVDVDPQTLRFSLPPEHAAFLTRAAAADNIAVFAKDIALLGGVEDDIDEESTQITQWLIGWSDGRRDALDKLMPVVYQDLRRLAGRYMQGERAGHSLQATALVHEAYVRLIDQRQVKWRNRAHFFGMAAGMMLRILVDHARARRAEKRGRGWAARDPDRVLARGGDPKRDRCAALHDSLERLTAFDPQQARIVELRYFGGLTIEEAAEVVGISAATVVREWTIAKAWLRSNLSTPSS